ncbi:MAG: pilus assembly protein TadG-related protein [Hyphomonadaceae bacterium]
MKFRQHPRKLKGYMKETSGNVAIIAALAIVPIISVIGFAVDWQLVVTKKNAVQHTLDATLIAAARERQAGRSEDDVRILSNNQFDALISANDPGLKCDNVQVGFVDDSQEISASVRCSQPTTLSAIFGRESLDFTVETGSTFGVGQVDVAFVFDLSGSMNSGGRLDALKDSATIAVEALLPEGQANNEEVRISIATYNHAVNAGAFFEDVTEENRRPNRMESSEEVGAMYEDDILGVVQIDSRNNRRFYDYETADGRGCTNNCNGRFSDWAARFYFDSTCVYNRLGDEAFTDAEPEDGDEIFAAHPIWEFFDGSPDNNRPDELQAKLDGQDEVEDQDGEGRRGQNGRTSGVVNFNNNDNDVDSEGSFTYGIRFNGSINDGAALTSCPESEPLALTADRADLLDYIDDMEALGGTAGHLGIAWGWYLISPEWDKVWPTASRPTEYFEEETAKAMIIMTDGIFNSRNAVGDVDSNEMAAQYCDNIKADTNITIFTVGFGVPSNAPTIGNTNQTILEYCATSDDFALVADNAEQLTDAYASIAAEISDLRLSQ